jgi:glycine/D-amino acid oxidase-like deaminating enzyme
LRRIQARRTDFTKIVMSNQSADVIIIGGGVIGSSIAYHLAVKNIDVMLFEQHAIASGSSGACDGAVLLQSKKPGIHLRLAMASINRFAELSEQLPYPIEFKNNGSMVVIEHEAELPVMRAFAEQQTHSGLQVSFLDSKEARELVPALSERIVGATFSSLDAKVHPIRLNLALMLGAKQRGARIRIGERVLRIDTVNGTIEGVTTSRGFYPCRVVVNAAGVLAPQVEMRIPMDIPIKPRRGQILVTQAVGPLAKCCMLSAGYIAAKFDPAAARRSGTGVSIDQTAKGNLLIGSTREFVGYNRQTTLAGLVQIAQRARQIIPGLASLNVIRSFAGLRPYTPDGLPILGTIDSVQGLIMAAGHEGDGIALSPVTGELIAQLIAEEELSIPLSPFSISRFLEHQNNNT